MTQCSLKHLRDHHIRRRRFVVSHTTDTCSRIKVGLKRLHSLIIILEQFTDVTYEFSTRILPYRNVSFHLQVTGQVA